MVGPKKTEIAGKKLPQRNGQLMGSVTSFPILCIINGALCRWALELSSEQEFASYISLASAKMCINGDDCVMVTNQRGREIWSKVTAFCGLKESVGKVYWSSVYLNMNSTCFFHADVDEVFELETRFHESGKHQGESYVYEHKFRRSNFVNLGLMMGFTRSGESASEDDDNKSIGARARKLLETCPDIDIPGYGENEGFRLREKLLTNFISLNSYKLKQKMRPWFIPERLGGCGLPCIGRYKPTDLELRMCRKIHENEKLPMRGSVDDWPLWKLAMDEAPKPPPFQLNSYEMTVGEDWEGSRMISYKDLVTLYCLDVLLKNAYMYEDDEDAERTYSHYNLTLTSLDDTTPEGKSKLGMNFEKLITDKNVPYAGRRMLVGDIYEATNDDSLPWGRYLILASVPSKKSWILSKLGTKLRVARRNTVKYDVEIKRVWRRALSSKIPMPEPYAEDHQAKDGYNFPIHYDIHEHPSIKLLMLPKEALSIEHTNLW